MTRGMRGNGGNKDVAAWLRKLSKTPGFKITHHGDRNPHWKITYQGAVVSTVGASASPSGFREARADVARALRAARSTA